MEQKIQQIVLIFFLFFITKQCKSFVYINQKHFKAIQFVYLHYFNVHGKYKQKRYVATITPGHLNLFLFLVFTQRYFFKKHFCKAFSEKAHHTAVSPGPKSCKLLVYFTIPMK